MDVNMDWDYPKDRHDREFWREMAIRADQVELKNAIREIEREKHEKHPTVVSEVQTDRS